MYVQIFCQSRERKTEADAFIPVVYHFPVVDFDICKVFIVQNDTAGHSIRCFEYISARCFFCIDCIVESDRYVSCLSGDIRGTNALAIKIICNLHTDRKLLISLTFVLDIGSVRLPDHTIAVTSERLVI